MTIEENVQRITEAKADIRSAIAEKGVEVSSEEKIDGYANLIRQIPTGGSGMEKFLTHTIEEINCPDVVVDNAYSMFYKQQNLKKAVFKVPDVIQNTVFTGCFHDCTSLENAPDFSNVVSVGISSFSQCFYNCTNLTTAPDFSNLTAVEQSSFSQCFNSCTSLENAPDFSNVVSVGENGFYHCFYECSSLIKAPDFRNIKTIDRYSFRECFRYCTNLSVVYAPTVETWDSLKFDGWLKNVAAKGVLYADKSMEGKIPLNSTSGCPDGWEIIYE